MSAPAAVSMALYSPKLILLLEKRLQAYFTNTSCNDFTRELNNNVKQKKIKKQFCDSF
jgi:hypothetical protein